jgi:beta-1,4-N-acetylglucosaminyltransferase
MLESVDKTVFVTVGTTLFDPLIDAVTTKECLKVMAELGYKHVKIQYGKGSYKTPEDTFGMSLEAYKYKPSLLPDIQSASLMISHAGAGSIMEGLEHNKKLLVVINPSLMDNHQSELAEALGSRDYLWHLESPDKLPHDEYQIIRQINALSQEKVKIWPEGESWAFPNFLDSFMGYEEPEKAD